MPEFFSNLFNTDGFMPRWMCGEWSAGHGYLHIISDAGIFGAYTAIPVVLAYFVLRRRDIPFPAVMWLFVAFIFSCGFGHLIEAFIFWHPVYRFSGLVKFFTFLVSWGTVIALIQIAPAALRLPGLARLNAELTAEVGERRRMEDALRDSEGKMAGLLESERHMRTEAEHANRLKDEFLSIVSHELRTPLNAILGYAQLLLHGHMRTEELQEGLTVIERNAKAQAQIIEDLLDMSRIISGKVRLDVGTVDLARVIEAAVEAVTPAAIAKEIRLVSVIDPAAGLVMGDSGRLQQVVWNLLSNSIKFTPKGGRVQVSLKRIESQVSFSVSDTGQGIKAEFLPHVFDRFRQGDSSTTRRHGGLGLGLSIVKQLVELHGGSISVESPGEGLGSTFRVHLPLKALDGGSPDHPRPANRPPTVEADESSEAISLKGLKVLVVDDESDARELVQRLLTEYEADVVLAADAEEALSLFIDTKPDVLISDIGMPGKDGYELMRSIRRLPPGEGGSVPAAALTALARQEDRKRSMLSGYQAHVVKPVDGSELIAIVASLAGRTGR